MTSSDRLQDLEAEILGLIRDMRHSGPSPELLRDVELRRQEYNQLLGRNTHTHVGKHASHDS